MHRLSNALSRFAHRDDGQDLLEYGLVATLIAIGAIVAVGTVGNVINAVWWQYIAQSI